ncbi:hypothetical protein [Xanthobacter tagetidis]|jgi:hypothetical protein|uniref:Uncharacterized protein n=1 Tax=Xanthobacter tagetidis TaxID=60216 RepID=A0A3L7AQ18_9HYPH|nr:hypothetical protein [Xanthobacter tagetidis]MBB6307873.1 hypothetical protein [Xanthobacter tagetidis]RLP81532.1 hypothetical protein D9R14_00535 [Xanthobacter tagetidis]
MSRSFACFARRAGLAAALAGLALSGASAPVSAASCLEQIVVVQQQLKGKEPRPNAPPPQEQSVAAQTDRQATPGSLAAAGVTQPDSGALGALNAAMNLQAAGDEAGCLKALAEARKLGGLN